MEMGRAEEGGDGAQASSGAPCELRSLGCVPWAVWAEPPAVAACSTAGAPSPPGLASGCVCVLQGGSRLYQTLASGTKGTWWCPGARFLESNEVMQMWICRWERSQVTEQEGMHVNMQTPSTTYSRSLSRYLTKVRRKATTARLENNRWLSCCFLSLVLVLLQVIILVAEWRVAWFFFPPPESRTCLWLRDWGEQLKWWPVVDF